MNREVIAQIIMIIPVLFLVVTWSMALYYLFFTKKKKKQNGRLNF